MRRAVSRPIAPRVLRRSDRGARITLPLWPGIPRGGGRPAFREEGTLDLAGRAGRPELAEERRIAVRHAAVLGLLASCALFSCSRSPNTPAGTVEAFYDAGKRGGQQGFLEYVQDKDREFLEKMRKPLGAAKVPEKMGDFSYRIVDEKVSGDTATVKVALKYEGKEDTQELKLVREGGRWKVDLIPDEAFEGMKALQRQMEAAKKRGAGAPDPASGDELKGMRELMESMKKEAEEAEGEDSGE